MTTVAFEAKYVTKYRNADRATRQSTHRLVLLEYVEDGDAAAIWIKNTDISDNSDGTLSVKVIDKETIADLEMFHNNRLVNKAAITRGR